uniref:Uncharacterized protein n=1 Tax=Panagrellus redivivus TaxID=6233 RepID=A0A7E4VX62_PANRE
MQVQMPELAAAHLHNNNHYCRSSSLNMAHPQMASHSHNHWGGNNRKRDFQFQVIEVNQGPKWFIWPSAQSSKEDAPAHPQKNNSDQENLRTVEPATPSVASANIASTTLTPVNNLPRRNSRFNRQRPPHLKDLANTATIDDSTMPPAPMSEPTPRRAMFMPNTTSENDNISVSAPSDTFKILSVARKSYQEDDDEDLITSKNIANNNNNNNSMSQ